METPRPGEDIPMEPLLQRELSATSSRSSMDNDKLTALTRDLETGVA